ncbi:F-box/FBD/LRR-repeat protein At1g13570 [Amborella trichopoda]|uniref:FBD domain-containing protein n=1 Tax=Amborella trichopoda TaxID=13333 RepID=W1PYF4_AMBTC|nr:F-box/FBD/LRR-repeat protein At1g13570 [Amborella trichopoda]ERN12986.1 hypothetical protein AMTR_s00040p00064030 [Amborella trichopoda]|eukprot:XP_020527253.1 F-box/FBD/LRR-repeat protein At1g13570 [Amborella trichopoda]
MEQHPRGVDRISSIPSVLLHRILCLLPIREAARTSILSRQWRYIWTFIPTLNFVNDSKSKKKRKKNPLYNCNWGQIIDKVLLLHNGPIFGFHLQNTLEINIDDIDQWVVFITKRGLQQLTIHCSCSGAPYKLHSSLFLCSSLVCLKLVLCEFQIPIGFVGFCSLKYMSLKHVYVSDEALESVVSKSPFLKQLVLEKCRGLSFINVNAPELLSFHIVGEFHDIKMNHSPNLKHLRICWDYGVPQNCMLNRVLKGKTKLQSLCLAGAYIEDLLDRMAERFLTTYDYLKVLNLSVESLCIDTIKEISFLLRSSPYLEALQLKISNDPVMECEESRILEIDVDMEAKYEIRGFLWKTLECDSITCLGCLRRVEIQSPFTYMEDMEIVAFLLQHAEVLNVLHIKISECENKDRQLRIVKRLASFPRASPHAKLFFK